MKNIDDRFGLHRMGQEYEAGKETQDPFIPGDPFLFHGRGQKCHAGEPARCQAGEDMEQETDQMVSEYAEPMQPVIQRE